MDELAPRRHKHERGALSMIRASFEAAKERGDAAFYLRPETAWLLLETAERAHRQTCKRCGGPLAYPSAVYCGAACSARAEEVT